MQRYHASFCPLSTPCSLASCASAPLSFHFVVAFLCVTLAKRQVAPFTQLFGPDGTCLISTHGRGQVSTRTLKGKCICLLFGRLGSTSSNIQKRLERMFAGMAARDPTLAHRTTFVLVSLDKNDADFARWVF